MDEPRSYSLGGGVRRPLENFEAGWSMWWVLAAQVAATDCLGDFGAGAIDEGASTLAPMKKEIEGADEGRNILPKVRGNTLNDAPAALYARFY